MKTKYLAFAAAAFMLASCSNDEDFVPQDDLKDTPITVSARWRVCLPVQDTILRICLLLSTSR